MDDPVVVEGDVGELRTSVDVTHRPHPLGAGAQVIVHDNETAFVGCDPGGGQVQGRGLGCASDRNQHRIRFEGANSGDHPPAVVLKSRDRGICDDLDAAVGEGGHHRFAHVVVEAGQENGAAFQDPHR